ncbi:MAG: hypothetical protein QOJ50_2670, partial [Cryptosporangiaceae bacterium]|nr:hypothetical protein [Cryptosporangiaceae bacterium]
MCHRPTPRRRRRESANPTAPEVKKLAGKEGNEAGREHTGTKGQASAR